MSCLHTISRSPDSKLLGSCLKVINDDDAILFIEDGVYHCLSLIDLPAIIDTVKIYGLREGMDEYENKDNLILGPGNFTKRVLKEPRRG